MVKIDWPDLIAKIVMWILGVILICMIILKILGYSPGYETIFGTALGIIATAIYHINYKLGKFIGENREFKRNVKESFAHMKDDINKLKKRKWKKTK